MAHISFLRLALLSALAAGVMPCSGQIAFSNNPTRFVVCNRGEGSFRGRLPDFSASSGVTVTVGAIRKQGFAARSCEASLSWSHGKTIIGSDLEQADIDVMGADLGFGIPVVAFQIKATGADPTIRYEIYSLEKPPRLLRTIVGEDYFSAADTRMDGTVEIWTTDAGAIRNFDGLPRKAFDVPPAMVLRFEQGRLLDVSAEYRPYFDRQIGLLRSQLSPEELSAFKASDGRLAGAHLAAEAAPSGLLATKVRVLELVWAYLNSGRSEQAWAALDAMWPADDVSRVRSAILAARSHGLRSQVDGVSDRTEPAGVANSAHIYTETAGFGMNRAAWQISYFADTAPQQILLRLPSPNNPERWDDQRHVEVLIDEAGKVRVARLKGTVDAGDGSDPDADWLAEAAGWKYIPAFKDGHPRAFTDHLRVLRDR